MDRDDYERQQLGELPVHRSRERREVYTQTPDAPLYGQPGAEVTVPRPIDVALQNRALREAQRAPASAPQRDFVVQSTFDARPINGQDFQMQGFFGLDIGGDPPSTATPVDLTFTVPSGAIAILRNFAWDADSYLAVMNPGQPLDQMEADEMLAGSSPYRVTLLVAGSIVRTYGPIYQQVGQRDCYAVAGETEKIILRFQQNVAAFSNAGNDATGYNPTISAAMYGNLLKSRGRATPYEPANEYLGDVLK